MEHLSHLQQLNNFAAQIAHYRCGDYERKWKSLVSSEFAWEKGELERIVDARDSRSSLACAYRRVVVTLVSLHHLSLTSESDKSSGPGALQSESSLLEEPDYGYGAENERFEYNLMRICRDDVDGNGVADPAWIFVTSSVSKGAIYGYHLLNGEFTEVASAWTYFAPKFGSRGTIAYSLGCILGYLYRWQTLSNLDAIDPGLMSVISSDPRNSNPSADARGNFVWQINDGGKSGQHLGVNETQKRAIDSLFDPIEIIHGPPGTGKSTTICEALLRRTHPRSRALICTTTNKAIDSIADKLSRLGHGGQLLAVGSQSRLGPSTTPFLLSNQVAADSTVRIAAKVRASLSIALSACDNVDVGEGSGLVSPDSPLAERLCLLVASLTTLSADLVEAGVDTTSSTTSAVKAVHLPTPSAGAAKDNADAAWTDTWDDPPDAHSHDARLSGGDSGGVRSDNANEDSLSISELVKTVSRVHCTRVHGMLASVLTSLSCAMTGPAWFLAPSLQMQLHTSMWTICGIVDAWECLVQSAAAMLLWERARFIVCTCSTAVRLSDRLQRDLRAIGLRGANAAITVDTVVLDECGAMLEVDAVGTLAHGARALLLVGDHFQLPPLSKWRCDEYTVSLLERLVAVRSARGGVAGAAHSGSGSLVHFLDVQYRMPPDQCRIVSDIFYGGQLTTAPEKEADFLVADGRNSYDRTVKFVDVAGREQATTDATFANIGEVDAVVSEVSRLIDGSASGRASDPSSLCVLTFYRGQARAVSAALRVRGGKFADVLVATVDAMQGREADHVIVSCVRTESVGFLRDARRINVAISRARQSLCIVGASSCLKQSPHWRRVLGFLAPSWRFYRDDKPKRRPGNVVEASSVSPSTADTTALGNYAHRPQAIPHADPRRSGGLAYSVATNAAAGNSQVVASAGAGGSAAAARMQPPRQANSSTGSTDINRERIVATPKSASSIVAVNALTAADFPSLSSSRTTPAARPIPTVQPHPVAHTAPAMGRGMGTGTTAYQTQSREQPQQSARSVQPQVKPKFVALTKGSRKL